MTMPHLNSNETKEGKKEKKRKKMQVDGCGLNISQIATSDNMEWCYLIISLWTEMKYQAHMK